MQIEDHFLNGGQNGLGGSESDERKDAMQQSLQQFSKGALCSSVPESVNIFNYSSISTLAMEGAHKYADFTEVPFAPVDNTEHDWEYVLEESSLKLYRRKPEKGDLSSFDTYQIRATVEGISAKELCHYFWDPDYRMEWEVSIDTPPTILCKLNDYSAVIHQFFTTIWPVKHRYSVFYSTTHCLPKSSEDVLSKHYVVNYSTNYPLTDDTIHKTSSKMIFAFLDVVLVAETRLKQPYASNSGDQPPISQTQSGAIKREDLVTEVAYICRIDPGGWIPASLAKMTSRKEYPRFFKRLVKCISDKCTGSQIEL